MLTLSTDSLKGYGLYRIFKFIKEAGYHGVDLSVDLKNYDTTDSEYLGELSKKFDLPVQAIQTPPKATADTVKKMVELGKSINCRIIIVQPPKIYNLGYARWLRNEVPKIRKKEEVSIALENAPNSTILGFIPEHAMNNLNELRRFKHACLDTSRLAQKKEELLRTYDKLKHCLVHIHLSNVYHSKYYYLPVEGILPLESFLTKLRHENYRGAISVKVNPKFLNVGNDDKVMKNLKEIKEFYEKYFLKK